MRIGAMPGVTKPLDAAARSSTYRSGMRLEAVMVSDLEGVLVYRHIGGLVNDGTGCALLVASGVVLRGGEQAVVDLAQGDGQRLFLRSEEHTSELQSRGHLVCRLLL